MGWLDDIQNHRSMQITLSGEEVSIREIKAHARRLGLKIYENKEDEDALEGSNSEELYQLMEEAASKGDRFKSISDPVAWQREQRKDRKLYGRDL